jgi:aspartate aminotransferase
MSTVSQRIADLETRLRPLLEFLTSSDHARRSGDPDISDFVFGNPHEMPLPGLVDSIRRHAIPEDKSWFAYTVRLPAATQAIAASLGTLTGLPFDPDDVFLTPGTFGGLSAALRATVDAGDEVIFLSPPWFFYESMIRVIGATPVRVRLQPPDFRVDADAVEAAITPRTRAILVNSPHNPTGRIYGDDELRALADVLARASARHGRPIVLLSDESYRRIVFDGRAFTSPAACYPHAIVLYTYGKQLLAPGERVGYLAISPACAGRETLRSAVLLSQILGGWQMANATLQRAVPDLEALSIDVATLERRRDRLWEILTGLGYQTTKPEATFYMMVRSPVPDDAAFTATLARHNLRGFDWPSRGTMKA